MGHSVQHTEALCEEEPSLDRKRWSAFRGLPLLFRDQVLSFFNTLYVRPQNNLVEIETPEIKCPARVLPQHKLQFIAPVLGVTFKKGTRTRGGGEKVRIFFGHIMEEVFSTQVMQKGRKGLCETHFTSLELTLNNFTSELSVNYFGECYRIKETCTGNSFRNISPFMFLSQAFWLSFLCYCCCFSGAPSPFSCFLHFTDCPSHLQYPILFSIKTPSEISVW